MMGEVVLLVHDDIGTIAAVRRLLSRGGYPVVLVTSVADVAIALSYHLPSLILLAPSIEGGRGGEVVAELLEPRQQHQAKLLLLGEGIPGVEADVLPLPLDGNSFLQMVRQTLSADFPTPQRTAEQASLDSSASELAAQADAAAQAALDLAHREIEAEAFATLDSALTQVFGPATGTAARGSKAVHNEDPVSTSVRDFVSPADKILHSGGREPSATSQALDATTSVLFPGARSLEAHISAPTPEPTESSFDGAEVMARLTSIGPQFREASPENADSLEHWPPPAQFREGPAENADSVEHRPPAAEFSEGTPETPDSVEHRPPAVGFSEGSPEAPDSVEHRPPAAGFSEGSPEAPDSVEHRPPAAEFSEGSPEAPDSVEHRPPAAGFSETATVDSGPEQQPLAVGFSELEAEPSELPEAMSGPRNEVGSGPSVHEFVSSAIQNHSQFGFPASVATHSGGAVENPVEEFETRFEGNYLAQTLGEGLEQSVSQGPGAVGEGEYVEEDPPGHNLDPQVHIQRLDAKYEEVQNGDYFSILGLARSAGTEEVYRAFGALSAEFNPLRFALYPDASVQVRAQLVHEALVEAANVLQDERLRTQYAGNLLD